jgi:hypothetical protein
MAIQTNTTPTSVAAVLTLRGPRDLAALGPFLKARRRAAGFRSAKAAALHLGVTTRLLVEVERGERTKRGITLGKLLAVAEQLGYELDLRPRRSPVVGTAEVVLPPLAVPATRPVTAPAGPGTKGTASRRPRRS